MTDTVTICLYKSWTLPALVVRLDTRRPGQPFADVPSHCAVVIDGTLYEFVSTGWQSRPATTEDLAWSVAVPVPDKAAALAFALSQRGQQYGWDTIKVIALARLVPDRWLSGTHQSEKHICAWFVESVLLAGGWDEPGRAKRQDVPLSPNDILCAVRESVQPWPATSTA